MSRKFSRPIVFAIFTIGLSIGSLSAETPKYPSERNGWQLRRLYVKLVLAMGEHDTDYVDAYYGPAEWKDAAAKEKKPLGRDRS